MNRLGDDHDNHVVGFERMSDKTHDAVCAWATSENTMSGLIAKMWVEFRRLYFTSRRMYDG